MIESELLRYAKDPLDFVLDKYRKGYKIVVIGEVHNSLEHHESFCRLVELVKSEYSTLKLGLEMDVKWQKRVNLYVSTNRTSSNKYFEAGSRKGSGYDKIFDLAAKLAVPVLCLDKNVENRDKFMASRVCDEIGINDPVLIYIGSLHALSGGTFAETLKNRFGKDKVFTISQEVEDEARTRGSYTYGFTAEIDQSSLKNKSMAFDLRDSGLRKIFAQIDEGIPVYLLPGTGPWYNDYDGLIYLAKK
jgi:uncharacterized iron-regulated protein